MCGFSFLSRYRILAGSPTSDVLIYDYSLRSGGTSTDNEQWTNI